MVGRSGYEFGHPGYAWAWTRQALDWVGGLLEMACMGAGDHHMGLALLGKGAMSVPAGILPTYRRKIIDWQARATRHIAGNVSAIPGTIEHHWHGDKAKRRYIERWDVLVKHGFDPDTDIKRNCWGVLELAGNKPGLRQDIDRYFRARDEDSNSL
jgi:hypothetical protein